MGLTSFKCPNCGADVAFRGSDFTVCEYCRSQIVLDGIADKSELERLRRENEEYLRENTGIDVYAAKLKKWKRNRNIVFTAIGLLTFIAFILAEFASTWAYVLMFLVAVSVLLSGPPVLASKYPSYDEKTSKVTYNKKTMAGKMMLLYLAAFGIALLGTAIAAMIAVEHENDKEKSAKNVYVSSSTDEGADKAVNTWLNVNTSKNGGKEYYRCTIPDKALKKITDDGSFYEMAEEMNTAMDYLLAHDSITVTDVVRNDALNVTQLRGAENYFRQNYGCDVEAEKGYEYSFTLVQSSSGYEDREISRELCAVALGYGEWKVIEKSASELMTYGKKTEK